MDSLKILFIGNSYTFCNKMPWIVSELAVSAGRTLEVDMAVKGGVDFEWHFNNEETLTAINRTRWDYVVLQNRSLGPIEEKEKMHQYGLALHNEVQKCDAQTVLYMTWARQHIPEMQEEITEAYVSLAKKIDAKIAPVGIAWKNALEAKPELVLHTKDKSHPNPLGSYLAACVFYATFYSASPEADVEHDASLFLAGTIIIDGEGVVDLPNSEARFLQSIARKTVEASKSLSEKSVD